ncbi:MAG: type II secretion system GspH family protein [Fusobacterium sp.]|nr:type II secretion system GspH family protein [Fusobacterium sp.]
MKTLNVKSLVIWAFSVRGGGKIAFTMAEILLSLTIIGVVAAITLPSLTGNINERTWNTQRKALYARFSQAIALMPAMNQYSNGETFITDGLAKVLKINNICSDDLEDCGFPAKITTAGASVINSHPTLSGLNHLNTSMSWSTTAFVGSYENEDIEPVAFETQNSESILAYYNPNCKANMQESDWYYAVEKVCANFIYDLNGSKGPNTVGKDIGFITVIYPSDSIVAAPVPYLRNSGVEVDFSEAAKKCTEFDSEYRAPNIGELISMFYNANLFDLEFGKHYWSTSRTGTNKAWTISTSTGRTLATTITNAATYHIVRCVKR